MHHPLRSYRYILEGRKAYARRSTREELEKLRRVPPFSLHAAIAIQPVPGVEQRAAFWPLVELDLPVRLRDREVLIVDPRHVDHRETLLDDRLSVFDVEAEEADVP